MDKMLLARVARGLYPARGHMLYVGNRLEQLEHFRYRMQCRITFLTYFLAKQMPCCGTFDFVQSFIHRYFSTQKKVHAATTSAAFSSHSKLDHKARQ